MKSGVYLIVFLLIIPVQASLMDHLSVGGIKPDLAMSIIYAVGLLASPAEAAVAGMGLGLVQDIGSAGLLGFTGFTLGLVGLLAGLLGRQVLNIASPSNFIFLFSFSLAQGVLTALLVQLFYGSMPFFSTFFSRMVPQALYAGILGVILLRLINRRNVLGLLRRRSRNKEF